MNFENSDQLLQPVLHPSEPIVSSDSPEFRRISLRLLPGIDPLNSKARDALFS